jgi:hypothetical protein
VGETAPKGFKGFHVGDSLGRLRQVYRRAKLFISQRWTLIARPFAGTRLPTLLATVNKKPDRRVRRPKSLAVVVLKNRSKVHGPPPRPTCAAAARARRGLQGESSKVIMAREAGQTFDERSGSDGTRTRDLRRDRPAF